VTEVHERIRRPYRSFPNDLVAPGLGFAELMLDEGRPELLVGQQQREGPR
jgi:hypothetical protein